MPILINMNSKNLLCLLSLLLPMSLWGVVLKGKLVGPDHEPIAFANVILLNDNLFVAGVTTSATGQFSISSSQAANLVKISMIGYEDIFYPLTEDSPDDLGTIMMQEASVSLNEVVVKGKLPQTRLKGNSMVTQVKNSVLANLGNGYDVLTHIPMVTGSNGELSVFGRGTPTVFINGREVRDYKDLRQLKSENIRNVELITNPGSSYASNVNSVIRITTVANPGDGIGFDFTETLSAWSYARSTSDLNMVYNHNGLEVFCNLDVQEGKKRYEDLCKMTTFGNQTFSQTIDNSSRLSTESVRGKLGFSYMAVPKHSFGFFYRLGKSDFCNLGLIETGSRRLSDISDSHFDYSSTRYKQTSRNYPSHEANVYYDGTIGRLSLDFNADFLKHNSDSHDYQSEIFESGRGNKTVEASGSTSGSLFAEKLVISHPMCKGMLEVGEEVTNSRLSYNFTYFGVPISNSITDIHEDNFAGFATLSQKFGEWNFSLGIRYERAHYRYYDNGILDAKLSREYSDIFPSLSIDTKIGAVGISLSFANKMKRPSYRKLDGGIAYINRYVYQSGNPMLRPTKIYNAQVMGMWRSFYGILMYNHEIDAVFNTIRDYGEDPLVKIMTYMNVPHYQYLQSTLGAQLKVGCWHPTPEIGMLKQFCTVSYRGEKRSFNKPMFSFTIDNVFSLPNHWQIGADLWFYSESNSMNCFVESTQWISLSVRKTFFNGNLMFQLKGSDLLDRGSNRVTIYSGEIKNYMFNHHEPRNITLTIRYAFNKKKSKYKGSGAGKTEKSRM